MTDEDLPDRWARTAGLLGAARGRLPASDGPGTDDFLDYLSHNELGLAFDVLVEVGRDQRATSTFWASMEQAADEMELSIDDRVHGASVRTIAEWRRKRDAYPCPCCGHLVFNEPPGSDEICPICFWQDDIVQLRWPNFAGGANRPCLIDAQANSLRFGASDEKQIPYTRRANDGEELDPGWRPWDPSRDDVEERLSGHDYGRSYATDTTVYYYWQGKAP